MRPPALSNAEAVEEAFYDAMQRGDLAAMMALWADDDEVVCIHPGGPRLIGLDAVRASWEAIFGGGRTDITVRAVRAHNGAMLAVHTLIEQIRVHGSRGTDVVECLSTNVYVKGPRGWRILIHHASHSDGAENAPGVPSGAILH